MSAKVSVTGNNRVIRKLGELGKFAPFADVIMKRWTNGVVSTLAKKRYPPELPNQMYERTGQLGRKFSAKRVSRAKYVIENSASKNGRPYAVYVVGIFQNVKYHKGRWWLMRDVADEQLPKLTRAMGAKVQDIWDG